VPESFVIDREGIIIKKEIGPREWDQPESAGVFRRLLGLDNGPSVGAPKGANTDEPKDP
jgi:hypothetical protein